MSNLKKNLLTYILFASIFYCCNTALKDPFEKIKADVSPSLETYHIVQNSFIKETKKISGNDFLSLNALKDTTDLLNKRKKISDLDELISSHEKKILRAHKIYTDSYLRVINSIKENTSKYHFDTLTISDIEIVALKNIDDMYIHTKDFIQVHKDISLLWKQYFDVVEDCGDFTYNGVQFNTSSCVEEYNYVVNKLFDIEHGINQKWSEEKIWNNWRGYVSGATN
jgi:hypothetical protein